MPVTISVCAHLCVLKHARSNGVLTAHTWPVSSFAYIWVKLPLPGPRSESALNSNKWQYEEKAVETDARHGKPGSMGKARRDVFLRCSFCFPKGNQLAQ